MSTSPAPFAAFTAGLLSADHGDEVSGARPPTGGVVDLDGTDAPLLNKEPAHG